MFLLKIDPYKTTQDQYIKSTEKKLSVCVGTWSKKLRARFRRRSTHVLNLTPELSTAKERRLNQFGTAVLVAAKAFGAGKVRPAVRCLNKMSR